MIQVVNFVSSTIESGSGGALEPKILDRKQTAIFLKSYYTSNFDEREVKNIDPKDLMDWIAPEKVSFGIKSCNIDGNNFTFFELSEYPLGVPNAWGRTFFSIPGARICCKFKPVEQGESEKRLQVLPNSSSTFLKSCTTFSPRNYLLQNASIVQTCWKSED